VGAGRDANDHQIAGADVLRAVGAGNVQVGIAIRADDLQAVVAHLGEIAAQQEMDIVTMLRQAAAVVAANRASADDGNTRCSGESGGGGHAS
jgi:hypothetical protein